MPEICTIDVFRVLLKCWLPDPEERPSFHELHEIFRDTFFKDPPRYLVIEGDSLKRQVQRNENLDMLDNLDLTPICDTGRTYSQEVSTPTMPSTPSKPLLRVEMPPSRDCNRRNESTSSHRYALDPLGIRSIADLDLSIVTPAGMDNYLLPDSIASKSRATNHPDLDSQQWAACEVYTPVIGGLSSPQLHHTYYNDVKKFIDCPDADFIDEGISSMGVGADHQSPSTSCKSSSSVKSSDVVVVVADDVDGFNRRFSSSNGIKIVDLTSQSRRPTISNDKTNVLATENLEYILPPNCRGRAIVTSYDSDVRFDDFATKNAQTAKNSAQIFDRQNSIAGDYTTELIENESCV
uniref:Serine-threonine/tyrosine-protein kinase catalytic domain-containing protein n=1 Tax=Romanomermis culicivorax TaxID=13658 RepID=A0A915J760_ROMCU